MPHTLQMLKKRDKKEDDLGAQKATEIASAEQTVRARKLFVEQLENYQKWKVENKIEGIRF